MATLTDSATRFPHRENGERIRRARHLTGLSQERFAPVVDTTRRHMIRLENGEQRPGRELRDRIVETTGTTEQIEANGDDEEEDMQRTLLKIIRAQVARRTKENPMGTLA